VAVRRDFPATRKDCKLLAKKRDAHRLFKTVCVYLFVKARKVMGRHYGREAGFTLLELMIVVIVISILIGVGVANYRNVIINSEDRSIRRYIALLKIVVQNYASENYVTSNAGYIACTGASDCNTKLNLDIPSSLPCTFRSVPGSPGGCWDANCTGRSFHASGADTQVTTGLCP
jgi:prepilin-type N-terminal cleavage/methylation domain-containing protein